MASTTTLLSRAPEACAASVLSFKDQPHNNLLASVCHAMGLSDVTSFGIPGVCTGPLSGLS